MATRALTFSAKPADIAAGLCDVALDLGSGAQGAIEGRIAAGPVGAHSHEIAILGVSGQVGRQLRGRVQVLGAGHASHGPRQAGQNIDGGPLAPRSSPGAERDMTIQRGAGLAGDRIVGDHAATDALVGFPSQDRVHRGHRSRMTVASPFDQAGQGGEDTGGIAALGRRLTAGQGDFAGGAGVSAQRVDEQEDPSAGAIAKPLGDGGGRVGGSRPHRAGRVGCGAYHHGAAQSGGAETLVDELARLAPAFADQADHADLDVGGPGDPTEQRRLARTRRSKEADSLAFAQSGETVDGPHATGQRAVDRRSLERAGRGSVCLPGAGRQRAAAVDRPAQAIQDAAEQESPGRDGRRLAVRDDRVADRDAGDRTVRHEQRFVAVQADHFGVDALPGTLPGTLQALVARPRDGDSIAVASPGQGGLDDRAGDRADRTGARGRAVTSSEPSGFTSGPGHDVLGLARRPREDLGRSVPRIGDDTRGFCARVEDISRNDPRPPLTHRVES